MHFNLLNVGVHAEPVHMYVDDMLIDIPLSATQDASTKRKMADSEIMRLHNTNQPYTSKYIKMKTRQAAV